MMRYFLLMCLFAFLMLLILWMNAPVYEVEEFYLKRVKLDDKKVPGALVKRTPDVLSRLIFRREVSYRWAYSEWGTRWFWCERSDYLPARVEDMLSARWTVEQALQPEGESK